MRALDIWDNAQKLCFCAITINRTYREQIRTHIFLYEKQERGRKVEAVCVKIFSQRIGLHKTKFASTAKKDQQTMKLRNLFRHMKSNFTTYKWISFTAPVYNSIVHVSHVRFATTSSSSSSSSSTTTIASVFRSA